jgi:hypothetical protein
MTREQRNEYYRNWIKSASGKAYKKRRCKENKSAYGGLVPVGSKGDKRGRYLSCNSSQPRLGKLADWGYGGYKRNGITIGGYHI